MKYFEIYNITDLYLKHIKDSDKPYLPAKINFILSQNFKKLLKIRDDIEQTRKNVIIHYGNIDETGNYQITDINNLQQAQKELDALSSMETNIDYTSISLKDIEDIEFSPGQFEAIEWMIKDEQDG